MDPHDEGIVECQIEKHLVFLRPSMSRKKIPFIALHKCFRHPLPEGHRFPMAKYELLPQQLLYEAIVTKDDFFAPDPVEIKFLTKVHQASYLERLLHLTLDPREVRRIGFPRSEALVDRELRITNGTILAALAALKRGIGFNIAGGTHHAGSDWGEGFCLLNDQAVAASYLVHQLQVKKVLIIDLDVHQGNGTAEIFQNEPRVFTFSVHGQNNYPFKKEKSDWDIGLPDGTKGSEYLKIVEEALQTIYYKVRPEFIFYQAGVDVLETDKMGKLKLTLEDCRQRDQMVFRFCKKWNLPVQVSMGGGYSAQLRNLLTAHCNTFKEGILLLLR